MWGGRERDTANQENNLKICPVFVYVWILISSKDFAKIVDDTESDMKLLNILHKRENPWLHRTLKISGVCIINL